MGIHWILGKSDQLGTFGGTYLEAQKELEGLLRLYRELYKTIELVWSEYFQSVRIQ